MSGKETKGYLPCFSKHKDKEFDPNAFYGNKAFVSKLKKFLYEIIESPNIRELNKAIQAKGGIQQIDPNGNKSDKELCQKLGWVESKVYRVDYGNIPYRLLFGLDNSTRRCYILALDANHQTRNRKKR
jgi:mRNA-degrading endonuclease RelE of RelBE toxin-antitoxin system